MKRISSLVLATAAALALGLASRDASALGAEVGADVGYGLKPFGDPAGYTANRFGVGVGAHAGIDIFHLYLGASIRYFFADGSQLEAGPTGSTGLPETFHKLTQTLQVGGEVGFQWTFVIVTLRPYLWAGPTVYLESSDNPNITVQNSTRFSLAPGLLARVRIVKPLFVGADVRYSVILGGEGEDLNTQLSLMATVGVAF